MVEYPSHGYVIDREEAQDIFEAVRAPTDVEERICQVLLSELMSSPKKQPLIEFFSLKEYENTRNAKHDDVNVGSDTDNSAKMRNTGSRETGKPRNMAAGK